LCCTVIQKVVLALSQNDFLTFGTVFIGNMGQLTDFLQKKGTVFEYFFVSNMRLLNFVIESLFVQTKQSHFDKFFKKIEKE
jgi:hypothetical protein